MPIPSNIIELITEAEAAWHDLPEAYRRPGSSYSRADPYILYSELRRMPRPALRFLEWGSGLGVVSIMAGLLGMDACGIEFDARLVDAARALATRFGGAARFAVGTFVPDACECPAADDGETYLLPGGVNGYAELARSVDDFDLIYAYPAPDHVDWHAEHFRNVARVGARLWLYTETAGILTCVKTDATHCTRLVPA